MASDLFGHEDQGWGDEGPGEEYWRSYADLLAGLLLVFALLLLTAFHHYQSRAEPIRDLVETRREIADTLSARFAARRGEVTVQVDSVSGSVRFDGKVLFDVNSASLREDGQGQLEVFAAEYLSVLFGVPRFREKLESIVVEGHTDNDPPRRCVDQPDPSDCAYLYNLDLSQRRALSVMTFLIERASDHRDELKRYVTANGRSFASPIFTDEQPTEVDDERSRRIEIRFRLNDTEVIKQIIERLFFS